MNTGCTEPFSSSFASDLVFSQKERWWAKSCVDYCGIIKRTIPDHYPFPRIDDLIDVVGCCKGQIFTTLDLMKGYYTKLKCHHDLRKNRLYLSSGFVSL